MSTELYETKTRQSFHTFLGRVPDTRTTDTLPCERSEAETVFVTGFSFGVVVGSGTLRRGRQGRLQSGESQRLDDLLSYRGNRPAGWSKV